MEAGNVVGAGGAAALATGAGLYALWRRRGAVDETGSVTAQPGAAERMRRGLTATRQRLASQLDAVLGRGPRPLDVVLGELEEGLVGADVGVRTTAALLEPLRAKLASDASPAALRAALDEALQAMLAGPPPPEPVAQPWVILVTGVNGVGKTTTIGKLAALHVA